MKIRRLSNPHLGALVLALAAAFVLLPRPTASALTGRDYGDQQHLEDKVTTAFVGYWRIGRRSLTPRLAHLVDYWRWFHVVKAAAAIGLLVVLVLLAARMWSTYARSQRPAWPTAAGGLAATVLSVFAFVLAMANIQGTFAPFSGLMSMLPINSARGQLATMVRQVKLDLAHYPSGSPGPLGRMIDDLAWYHAIIATITWPTAVLLVVLMIACWRRYARTNKSDRRGRRLLRSLGMASVIAIAAVVVLAIANTTATIDSPTAVLNFYRGTY